MASPGGPVPKKSTLCSLCLCGEYSSGDDLMDPCCERGLLMNRRHFFGRAATGMGAAALAALLQEDLLAQDPGAGRLPHFAGKAKRVVYLFQNGAPTHVDLFDYKPSLTKMMGEEIPASVYGNQRLTTMTSGQKNKKLLPNIAPMKQYGPSGAWITDFMPWTARIADEACLMRSMPTEAINHAPASTLFLPGAEGPGRPRPWAWLS